MIAAVCSLEDAPCFNAGKGATYTMDGRFELDASIMDGQSPRGGCGCRNDREKPDCRRSADNGPLGVRDADRPRPPMISPDNTAQR